MNRCAHRMSPAGEARARGIVALMRAVATRFLLPLMVAAAISGCARSGDGETRAWAPFVVDAHCGVQYISINGVTWETKRRDDGQGNPPKGWPQAIEGRLKQIDDDTAIFISDRIPVRLVFHPAPEAQWTCA